MPCASSRSSSSAACVSAIARSKAATSAPLPSRSAEARPSRHSYERASNRCWAPSWRSRSRRRRAASPVSTILDRDSTSSRSWASTAAFRRSLSIASRAAAPIVRSSSSDSTSPASWTTTAMRLTVPDDRRRHLPGPGRDAGDRPPARIDQGVRPGAGGRRWRGRGRRAIGREPPGDPRAPTRGEVGREPGHRTAMRRARSHGPAESDRQGGQRGRAGPGTALKAQGRRGLAAIDEQDARVGRTGEADDRTGDEHRASAARRAGPVPAASRQTASAARPRPTATTARERSTSRRAASPRFGHSRKTLSSQLRGGARQSRSRSGSRTRASITLRLAMTAYAATTSRRTDVRPSAPLAAATR